MARLGMDTDVLSQVHTQLQSLKGQLDSLVGSISTQVQQAHSNWDGSDSNQFESEWNSTHKVALTNASSAIDVFAAKLRSNMSAQESTSSTY